MIGDILTKVARREPLSVLEEQNLLFWGNNRQVDFVSSMQNGTANIRVNNLRAISGNFRWQPFGLSSKVGFTATAPASTADVKATFNSVIYDELKGYTASSTDFKVPFTAKYALDIFVDWEPYSGGVRDVFARISGVGGLNANAYIHSANAGALTLYLRRETSLYSGYNINVHVSSSSGVDLDCSGTMVVRLLRNHDGSIA